MAFFPFPPSLACAQPGIRGMRNRNLDYLFSAAWKVVFMEGRIQPSTASRIGRIRQTLQQGQGRSRTTVLSTERSFPAGTDFWEEERAENSVQCAPALLLALQHESQLPPDIKHGESR